MLYVLVPNTINPMYTEQLREMIPPPNQNSVGLHNQITLTSFTILSLGW